MFQELEDDGRGNAVREIADENIELRERNLDGVSADERDPIAVGLLDVIGEVVVQLYAGEAVGLLRQALGQYAEARADLQDPIMGTDAGILHMPVGDPPVGQEVLPAGLAGPNPCLSYETPRLGHFCEFCTKR